MNYARELEITKQVARRVGLRIAEVLTSAQALDVTHKGTTDLVTDFDLWAEQEITAELKKYFPQYLLIGEETAATLQQEMGKSLEQIAAENTCWIVDPIDGTSNFVNRIPHVGISIGLVEKGIPVMGVVYDPCRDEMFSATRGQGAKLNEIPIQVCKKDKLINSLIATGFPYEKQRTWALCKKTFEAVIQSARGIRRFGAATLDGCWVACGRFDGFYEYGLHAWDVAAISVIVEEAGGIATNRLSKKGEYSLFADNFIFAPPALVEPMRSLMQD